GFVELRPRCERLAVSRKTPRHAGVDFQAILETVQCAPRARRLPWRDAADIVRAVFLADDARRRDECPEPGRCVQFARANLAAIHFPAADSTLIHFSSERLPVKDKGPAALLLGAPEFSLRGPTPALDAAIASDEQRCALRVETDEARPAVVF